MQRNRMHDRGLQAISRDFFFGCGPATPTPVPAPAPHLAASTQALQRRSASFLSWLPVKRAAGLDDLHSAQGSSAAGGAAPAAPAPPAPPAAPAALPAALLPCAECKASKPAALFTGSQLKKEALRRCRACVDAAK
jgi:hypothetical protein